MHGLRESLVCFAFAGVLTRSGVSVPPLIAPCKRIKAGLQVNMFRPRKGIQNGLLKKITVNHLPKKKRFSLIW